jgi:hypothetical protein
MQSVPAELARDVDTQKTISSRIRTSSFTWTKIRHNNTKRVRRAACSCLLRLALWLFSLSLSLPRHVEAKVLIIGSKKGEREENQYLWYTTLHA